MTDTITKAPTLDSTKQALAILQSLRDKRRQDKPCSIQSIVKEIYVALRNQEGKNAKCKVEKNNKELNRSQSEAYLNECSETKQCIEDMLMFIRDQVQFICSSMSAMDQSTARSIASSAEKGSEDLNKNPENQQNLTQMVRDKDQQIQCLTKAFKQAEHKSKLMQMKLLNNAKKLNIQLQQKDCELAHLRDLLEKKTEEAQDFQQILDQKFRKIRQLEEDLFDLNLELENKEQQLEAEKECSLLLEKKISRIYREGKQGITKQGSNWSGEVSGLVQALTLGSQLKKSEKEGLSQIGIQTQEQGEVVDDKLSLTSNIQTESKESHYIQSIQKLTQELGEAYHRISELTKEDNLPKYNKNKTRSGHFAK